MEKVLTDMNYSEVIPSEGVALIDFWAPWCGPCRMLAPTVDEIAVEFEGKVTVAKCNVDDCEETAVRFGIRNIPTLVFIKDSEMVGRTVGVISKDEIVNRINNLL